MSVLPMFGLWGDGAGIGGRCVGVRGLDALIEERSGGPRSDGVGTGGTPLPMAR